MRPLRRPKYGYRACLCDMQCGKSSELPNTIYPDISLRWWFMEINYTVQMIKPLLERTAKSFEVATSAFDEYNRNIQQRISRLVYTECASWYNRAGGRTGKNTQSFPGPLLLFWWWTRTPNWEHYKAVGAEKWDLERRRKKLRNIVLGLCTFVLALSMSRKSARSLIWKACFDWQDALRLWRETRSRLWNTL